MANGSNKTGLLNFLAREWSENAIYAEKSKEHTLFVTHGDNIAPNSPPLMAQLLHAQSWNFAAIKRKRIPGCSSMQIMLLKMDISTLL